MTQLDKPLSLAKQNRIYEMGYKDGITKYDKLVTLVKEKTKDAIFTVHYALTEILEEAKKI